MSAEWSPARSRRLPFVDSHTGGEPTRVVLAGGPDLGTGTVAERARLLAGAHDDFRASVVLEPRGSDVLVGALLCEAVDPGATAGVIFFNNVGYLGMCGHGTIGLVTTLAHLGRIAPGLHRIETPVGDVVAELHDDGRVSVHNVPAYRLHAGARVSLDWEGRTVAVSGDVAWGGNWFFLCEDDPGAFGLRVDLGDRERLTDFAWRVRAALAEQGVHGVDANGTPAEVDHVELFAPGTHGADARSFVLCPGRAYDRSPCGTGTSAKLACLAATGRLEPGATWVQESVTGSRFEARYTLAADGRVLPVISGTAHVTAEGELVIDPRDPFAAGIR